MSQATAAPSLATEYRKWPSKPEARKLPGATIAMQNPPFLMVFTRCHRVKWNIDCVDYVSYIGGYGFICNGWQTCWLWKNTGILTARLVSLLITWGTSCYETYKWCDFKSWAKQAWKVEKPTKPWQNERGQGIQQRDMTRSTRWSGQDTQPQIFGDRNEKKCKETWQNHPEQVRQLKTKLTPEHRAQSPKSALKPCHKMDPGSVES